MANATEELKQLQDAADRGDLERTTRRSINEQHQQQLAELVSKRWIIVQATEVAKATGTSVGEFKELCEFIQKFIA